MRQLLLKGTLLVAMGTLVFACDIIKGPRREVKPDLVCSDTVTPVPLTGLKNVLIEEYTGYTCGNCPPAAETAKNLSGQFPGRVFVMTVHAGFFADPIPSHPEDYRTPVGTELDQFFGMSNAGNPNGMVDRKAFNGQQILAPSSWSGAVNARLQDAPVADMALATSYEAATRTVVITTHVKYNQTGEPEDKLVLHVLEDSIVGFQKDYRFRPNENITNYVHRYLLRASVTPSFGLSIQEGAAPVQGQSYKCVYRYVLPEEIDPEHAYIIGYINRNRALKGDNLVLQSDLAKVK
jgi:hypothetical protein